MTSTQALGSLKNHFLIAMPALKDSVFEHSITYICSHDSNGAMGIVLNQSTDLNLQEVLEQLEIEGACGHQNSVLLGGPVHQDHGFILHLEKGDWRSTLSVTDDIHVSTSKDILTSLAQGEGPKQYKVALGYAGWEAGQLEQELLDNSWITVAANTDIIFNTPENEMYQAALRLLGIDEGFLSSDAGHA
jgi:putative transcriptional regulator